MNKTRHTTTVTVTAMLGGIERVVSVEADGCVLGGRLFRVGNDGTYVSRRKSGLLTWLLVGRIPANCRNVLEALHGEERARWGSTVSLSLQIDDQPPAITNWERTEIHLIELGANAEHIWVLMDVSGYQKRTTVEIEPIAHANCMMCGEEKNPGKVVRGISGDVIVLCDHCAASLVTEKAIV